MTDIAPTLRQRLPNRRPSHIETLEAAVAEIKFRQWGAE